MKTLAITLTLPPKIRVINGTVETAIADAVTRTVVEIEKNPPPLIVDACAKRARARSGRLGWKTRKGYDV